MQEQVKKPVYDVQAKTKDMYQGPKKLAGVKNILGGIEDLVAKGNLAENYKQEGAQ